MPNLSPNAAEMLGPCGEDRIEYYWEAHKWALTLLMRDLRLWKQIPLSAIHVGGTILPPKLMRRMIDYLSWGCVLVTNKEFFEKGNLNTVSIDGKGIWELLAAMPSAAKTHARNHFRFSWPDPENAPYYDGGRCESDVWLGATQPPFGVRPPFEPGPTAKDARYALLEMITVESRFASPLLLNLRDPKNPQDTTAFGLGYYRRKLVLSAPEHYPSGYNDLPWLIDDDYKKRMRHFGVNWKYLPTTNWSQLPVDGLVKDMSPLDSRMRDLSPLARMIFCFILRSADYPFLRSVLYIVRDDLKMDPMRNAIFIMSHALGVPEHDIEKELAETSPLRAGGFLSIHNEPDHDIEEFCDLFECPDFPCFEHNRSCRIQL